VQARNNSTERSALRARRLRGPLAAMTSRTKLENLTVRLELETREALERLAEREERPLAIWFGGLCVPRRRGVSGRKGRRQHDPRTHR
jgi:hypothetical protein